MHVALRRTIFAPVRVTDVVEASKDSANLADCSWKKFFCLGMQVVCVWCHKWRTFRPPWPTSNLKH